MSLDVELPRINVTFTNTNQNSFTLEVLDYFPVVSNVSGVVRGIFGTIQSVIGVVAFPFQLIGRVAGCDDSFVFAKGISNMVRGSIASTPFAGNVTLFIYDHMPAFKRDFQYAVGIDR